MKRLSKDKITKSLLSKVMDSKNYQFFTDSSKPYNLNIIGIRADENVENTFNDYIVVAYPQLDEARNISWVIKVFEATTDPGLTFRLKPIDAKFGTAILVPGQYKGVYQRGIHSFGSPFQHEALRQVKPLKVYRDANKDKVLDFDPTTIKEGIYYINLHRASLYKNVPTVDSYSAGCQVIQKVADHLTLMDLVKKAEKYWGKSFTYTLLDEVDFYPFL